MLYCSYSTYCVFLYVIVTMINDIDISSCCKKISTENSVHLSFVSLNICGKSHIVDIIVFCIYVYFYYVILYYVCLLCKHQV